MPSMLPGAISASELPVRNFIWRLADVFRAAWGWQLPVRSRGLACVASPGVSSRRLHIGAVLPAVLTGGRAMLAGG